MGLRQVMHNLLALCTSVLASGAVGVFPSVENSAAAVAAITAMPGVEACSSEMPDSIAGLNQLEISGGLAPSRASAWIPGQGGAQARRGVALLVHGLNLKPEKMNAVAEVLTKGEIDVLRLTLPGHDGNLEAMKSASRVEWLAHLRAGYCVARKEADRQSVPLFLVAYSLGGLLALDLANSAGFRDISFDRTVLFAPAIGARAFAQGARLLRAFPGLVIPSASPAEFRANPRGTSIAAYNALLESISSLERTGLSRSQDPTLVFVDPDDELVSSARLTEVARSQPGLRWRVERLAVQPEAGHPRLHHLIVEPTIVGLQQWQFVEKALLSHLSSASQPSLAGQNLFR